MEQIIRPTGLLDPEIIVRPADGQVDDLIGEIHACVREESAGSGHHADQTHGGRPDRVSATNWTSRCEYLHSDVDTLERHASSSASLRLGEFDVLVGINLLREGLDMPEVALVAILDADKEGFLRIGNRR